MQSRVQAVEMSYMRGACGLSRWDRESNEDTYGRFGMSETATGMDCRVVEWVKRSTLRWYGCSIFFFMFSPCAPVGIICPLVLSRAGPFVVRAGVYIAPGL